MKLRTSLAALLLAALAACATPYPTTPDGQVRHHLRVAEEVFARNGEMSDDFGIQIGAALNVGSHDAMVKAALDSQPALRAAYYRYCMARLARLPRYSRFAEYRWFPERTEAARLFAPEEARALRAAFVKRVTEGNLSGEVALLLDDPDWNAAELRSREQQKALLENTLAVLAKGDVVRRPVNALLAYAVVSGPRSPEWQRVRAALPGLAIQRSELPDVRKVFPDVAEQLAATMTIGASLRVMPDDRLLFEDLYRAFTHHLRGVQWLPGEQPLRVTIERLRHDERQIPPRTETIAYSQSQVDAPEAAQFMTRNSSYLFDLLTATAEIEYGYAVKVDSAGRRLLDELVRGRVTASALSCRNPRVQNAYGAVQPAGFVANADMRSRCGNGEQVPIDQLRAQVNERIAEVLLQIEGVQRAQPRGG